MPAWYSFCALPVLRYFPEVRTEECGQKFPLDYLEGMRVSKEEDLADLGGPKAFEAELNDEEEE